MLDAYPELKALYDADDGNTQVFYFKNATATLSSFTKPQETLSFERFQKIDRHLLRTRSVGIMEEEQARHRRSYYPDILICRLMPVMVYDRESGFIHLYVVRGEGVWAGVWLMT